MARKKKLHERSVSQHSVMQGGRLMLQYLARGAFQTGSVVAGGRQGADTQLQPTDHLVAAGQL